MTYFKMNFLLFPHYFLIFNPFHTVQSKNWKWKLTSLEDPLFLTDRVAREARDGYRSWQKVKWGYPQILDLDKHFSAFQPANCLIAIDNFAQINFLSFGTPVIQRVMFPAVILQSLFFSRSYAARITWSKNVIMNSTDTSDQAMKWICSPSDYITLDLCTSMIISMIIGQGKPWTCQINVAIFPPYRMVVKRTFYARRFPKLLSPKSETVDENNLPLPLQILSAFYIVVKTKLDNVDAGFIQEWTREILEGLSNSISEPSFYIFTISFKYNLCPLFHRNPNNALLVQIEKVRFCTFCSGWTIELIPAPEFPIDEEGTQTEMTLWRVYVSPDERRGFTSDQILRKIVSCDTLPGNKPFLYNSANQTAEDFLSLLYANVWFSLMKNYTTQPLLFSPNLKCINGVKEISSKYWSYLGIEIKSINFMKSFVLSPYSVSDKINSLRFVTCGRRGISAFAFSELFSVFDNATWIALFACMIAVTFTLWHQSKCSNDKIFQIFATFKVFLEQGDTFQGATCSNGRLRLIVGISLLMGIIVSNSYKNTNVYRMIVTRAPLQFETFEQLVEHNFTVYSRLSTIERCYFCSTMTSCVGTLLQIVDLTVCAKSEADTRTHQVRDLIGDVTKLPAADSKTFLAIRNFTRIHPKVERTIEERKVDFNGIAEVDKMKEFGDLFESVKNCRGAALILRDHLCNKVHQDLVKLKVNNASIGKEMYSDVNFFFELKGHVSDSILKRIKGISASGIWDFLLRLVSNVPTDHHNPQSPPRPASIHGNIIVIFSLWISGEMVSIVWFLFEIRDSVWKLCIK